MTPHWLSMGYICGPSKLASPNTVALAQAYHVYVPQAKVRGMQFHFLYNRFDIEQSEYDAVAKVYSIGR